MTEAQISNLFFLLVKTLVILVLVFNAGIGLILLRQIGIMNSIIKAHSLLIRFLVIGLLVVVILALLYAVLA